MKYRRLGRNGPQASSIGLGRGSQPIQFGDPLEQEFNATVRRVLDLGIGTLLTRRWAAVCSRERSEAWAIAFR